MRDLRAVLVALLVVGLGPTSVFAACPAGQVLRKIGTVHNSAEQADDLTQLVDGPISINAWSWACTGTACTPTVYDGDEAGDETDAADVVAERGGIASGGGFEEFNTPLGFTDGVTVGGLNIAGFNVYTCQP